MKAFTPQRKMYRRRTDKDGIYFCSECGMWTEKKKTHTLNQAWFRVGEKNILMYACSIHPQLSLRHTNMTRSDWLKIYGNEEFEWPNGAYFNQNEVALQRRKTP